MPEIVPIDSTVHFKAAFDINGGKVAKPMTHLRQKLRTWCIKKTACNEQVLHRAWFYVGNNAKSEPAQYCLNDHYLRTISAPGEVRDEPSCWAFEMIHPDRDEGARRWSVEITLRKNEGDMIRFTTVVRNWMLANFIGEYPAPPLPSAPAYVRDIIADRALSCSKGDAKIHSQAKSVSRSTARTVYNELVSTQRQVPYVFIANHEPSGGTMVTPRKVATALIGNANVFVLPTEDIINEMNYYLGSELSCSPGSVRIYLTQLDKSNRYDSRRHRYLSASFITEHGEDAMLRFLANGLSRNGSTFRLNDFTSFSDIYSEKRKHKIKKLAALSDDKSEEAVAVWQDYDKVTTELAGWESTAIQYESENAELKKKLATATNRIEETERVRFQIRDLESQLQGIAALSTLPQNLLEVLEAVASLFPKRIEIAKSAIATAKNYSSLQQGFWGKPEGLAIAWQMAFGVATRLHDLVFEHEANNLESAFSESFSTFSLALSEGKQTNKDGKLMALRIIHHDGKEFDITPHVKFGTRMPRLLRLHFAFNRDAKTVVIGHFGGHMDNYTSKKL